MADELKKTIAELVKKHGLDAVEAEVRLYHNKVGRPPTAITNEDVMIWCEVEMHRHFAPKNRKSDVQVCDAIIAQVGGLIWRHAIRRRPFVPDPREIRKVTNASTLRRMHSRGKQAIEADPALKRLCEVELQNMIARYTRHDNELYVRWVGETPVLLSYLSDPIRGFKTTLKKSSVGRLHRG